MKFGLAPCQEKARWTETVEQTVKAEEWGYDSIWISEHHSVEEGYFPSPWVALAGLASYTKNVQLGTAVLIVPYYHPFHIAEDATMLDIISGGRCVVGLGVGYREEEFEIFGVPIRERGGRTEEATQILLDLWTHDRVSFDGKYYQLRDARLLPKPLQRPRPPIWLGGWTEPACARAARLGDAWFPGPAGDLEKVKRANGFYQRALAERGEKNGKREFPLMRECFCCKDKEAEELARERLFHLYSSDYITWGHVATTTDEDEVTFEGLMKDRFIVGSPEFCIESLETYVKELGVDHLIFRMHFHNMPQNAVLDSMELFAKECMPYLKKQYP